MHRVTRAALGATTAFVLASLVIASPTARAAGPPASCDPITKQCRVVVTDPGHAGGGRSGAHTGGTGGSAASDPSLADLCVTTLADPQPPVSDPVWQGHAPSIGHVYVQVCPLTKSGPVSMLIWLPNGARPASVTAAQLARRALASLHLPSPTIERSPDPRNGDQGVPYTWVNVWTWYWTSPTSWQVLSRRVAIGPVWAQVTARPTALVFEPGDGAPAVSCPGPGRPWSLADGNAPPTAGGCGYMYLHVTVNGPLTATVSIRWTVTWTGSQGTGGTLPPMRTDATSRFAVEQLQAVSQ